MAMKQTSSEPITDLMQEARDKGFYEGAYIKWGTQIPVRLGKGPFVEEDIKGTTELCLAGKMIYDDGEWAEIVIAARAKVVSKQKHSEPAPTEYKQKLTLNFEFNSGDDLAYLLDKARREIFLTRARPHGLNWATDLPLIEGEETEKQLSIKTNTSGNIEAQFNGASNNFTQGAFWAAALIAKYGYRPELAKMLLEEFGKVSVDILKTARIDDYDADILRPILEEIEKDSA